MSCEEPAFHDFTALPNAATQILSAQPVPPAGSIPEYCLVTGYITPQIEFELRLTTRAWGGRYLQLGCGGFCSSADINEKLGREQHFGACIPDNLGGFVVGSSNSGHVGNGSGDGLWAQNMPQLKIDFGYRSEHELAIVAEAIIETFYGQGPYYTYFAGCSGGDARG